jgi:hypothetical protein
MSALPPKADIVGRHGCLLLTVGSIDRRNTF